MSRPLVRPRLCPDIRRGAKFRLQLSARTIADLAGSETITAPHVAEALQCRARGDVG